MIEEALNSDIFETFFRINPNLTCIASKNAIFEFLSPNWEGVLGWSVDELMSFPFLHFIHADDLPATLDEMSKLESGQTTFEFENRYRRKSGGYTSLLWNSIFHEGRFFAVARDITQVRQLEASKEQAVASSNLALIGEMTCGIAHELSTPLAIICEGIQIAKEVATSDQLTGILAMMDRASIQMSHIVKGMRTVAVRAETKRLETISLQEIVFQSRDFLKSKLIQHFIEFKNVVLKNVLIRAVPGDILQIFINLISNSVQALTLTSNCPRWIAISCETKSGIAFINVVDSGLGIASEIADRIIEPFFTTKEASSGIGLGLSISKRLAEQNHGKLYLVNTSPNTHFVLEIPVAEIKGF